MISSDSIETAGRGSKSFVLGLGAVLVAGTVALLASPFYLYCFVPAFLLLALSVLARFPQLGYCIIVFLVPLDMYRVLSEKYSALTVSKLVGAWVVVVMLVARVADRTRPMRIRSNLWPLFGLFLAACLASAILSEYRETAFLTMRQLAVAGTFSRLRHSRFWYFWDGGKEAGRERGQLNRCLRESTRRRRSRLKGVVGQSPPVRGVPTEEQGAAVGYRKPRGEMSQ